MMNYFFIPTYLPQLNSQTLIQSQNIKHISSISTKQYDILERKHNLLKKQFDQLLKEKDSLKLQIDELEARLPIFRKKTKKRRPQQQLVKNFKCPFQQCPKQYASQIALNLHMKVKHNAGTKKQRLVVIQNLIRAEQNGEDTPQISINLPPSYIEEFQKSFLLDSSKHQIHKFRSKINNQQSR